MEDEKEDVNWFKVLPWWQKILVLLVGFGIAALFFLGPDAFGQINENKSTERNNDKCNRNHMQGITMKINNYQCFGKRTPPQK